MNWSDDTARYAAPRDAATVCCAEDWAAATPPRLPRPEGWTAWCPVLVRLVPDDSDTPFATAVASIERHMATGKDLTLALDPFAERQLTRLKAANRAMGHLNGVVLHRPAAHAYDPALAPGTDPVFRVEHVGPALRQPARPAQGPDDPGEPDSVSPVPPLPPVLIAVIDDSFAFANARFRAGPRDTRVMRFWAMDDPRRDGATMDLGPTLSKPDIDAALVRADGDDAALYRMPVLRPLLHEVSHGTHVADLAAGAEMGHPAPPIVAVALPRSATGDTSGGQLETAVIQALHRVIYWADTLYDMPVPLVVNFSYGLHAGAKDGSGLIEAEIRRLAEGRSAQGIATRVVLPSGNSLRARGRSLVDLAPGETHSLEWRLPPDDRTSSFAEIWLDGPLKAILRFAPPDGAPVEIALTGSATCHTLRSGDVPLARIYVQPRGSRLRVTLAVAPSDAPDHPGHAAPAGAWSITLRNARTARQPLCATIEVQRDDTPSGFRALGRQSYLDSPDCDAVDPETGRRDMALPGGHGTTRAGTLSAYATGACGSVFVVGGSLDADDRAALYASAGPTRGRAAPDLSVASDSSRVHRGLIAAAPISGASAAFAGTSGAAPLIARALVDGLVGLSKSDALDAMIDSAPSEIDPQVGYGMHRAAPGVQPLRRITERPPKPQ